MLIDGEWPVPKHYSMYPQCVVCVAAYTYVCRCNVPSPSNTSLWLCPLDVSALRLGWWSCACVLYTFWLQLFQIMQCFGNLPIGMLDTARANPLFQGVNVSPPYLATAIIKFTHKFVSLLVFFLASQHTLH